MAYVYRTKRKGGKPAPFWSYRYKAADGRWRAGRGTTDKAVTLELARKLEAEARLEAAGLVEPGQAERRRRRSEATIAHVADYLAHLKARGDTAKHANHTAGVIARTLEAAGVETLGQLKADAIQAALGELKRRRSARTANHARGAVLGFVRWLADCGRIPNLPPGLATLKRYTEATDRRRVRRVFTDQELEALLGAAPVARRVLYLVAVGTGFRANELRSLTPESFRLEAPAPVVVVSASYSKRRREDRQPITRNLAALLGDWLEGKPAGVAVFPLPTRAAEMLREDLEAAGVPYVTADGVLDMHSFRHTYITRLARKGTPAAVLQRLARHSDVSLTLSRYVTTTDAEARAAIEGE